eukprot:TRINITY_DN656_c0_g1_i10.p3 TRINITY_DN656_c0_g1~~TRINITY_DN656_c0_g1_i10.p3  ORF type:complete len:132 (-),score=11.09 TRINITY_DN656_c0_g1_i10:55-450(-)
MIEYWPGTTRTGRWSSRLSSSSFGSVLPSLLSTDNCSAAPCKTQDEGSSFFQSVCVLGYCLCPLTISALIVKLFLSSLHVLIQFLVALLGFGWSTYSSYGFISDMVQADRKALAVYPLCLFYLFLALFIIL